MDETELISGLQSHLDSTLSVPIRSNGLEDERPVPVIIIDDWDTQDMNFHNSPFAGEASGDFDDDGNTEYEQYLNFDWKTRVTFLVRHTDEVEVSKLKEKLKHEIRLIRANPLQYDSELKECRLGADGNPTNKFTEPKESELALSAQFKGDHTITLTEGDVSVSILDAVTENFTFNP